jgi:hypothetical protein
MRRSLRSEEPQRRLRLPADGFSQHQCALIPRVASNKARLSRRRPQARPAAAFRRAAPKPRRDPPAVAGGPTMLSRSRTAKPKIDAINRRGQICRPRHRALTRRRARSERESNDGADVGVGGLPIQHGPFLSGDGVGPSGPDTASLVRLLAKNRGCAVGYPRECLRCGVEH